MPTRKRIFDLVICMATAVLWLPALLVASLAIWIAEGRPILYVSTRRVFRSQAIRVLKFRTMSRNADRLVNRDTVPVSTQRFLNIPIDSPLYTPIGRLVEQAHLTELPQLLHVLKGEMSLVGARPLPENVVSSLREVYPRAEDRFLTKSGLTGPVQLVGRDAIPDADRLRVEIAYSRGCLRSYSVLLDLTVLCLTVVIAVAVRRPMSVEEVLALIDRYTSAPSTVEKVVRRPESAGHPPDAKAS